MKKCVNCGAEYTDEFNYCGKCGGSLSELRGSDGDVCQSCGAPLGQDAMFCGKCGAAVCRDDGVPKCSNCGARLDPDSRFCVECGKPVEIGVAAPKRTVRDSVSAVKAKAQGFERKNHIVVNLITAALALVMIFVALFCPIKFSESLIGSFDVGDSETEFATESDVSSFAISQSIWQIFGAYKYTGLSVEYEEDRDKITAIYGDVQGALEQSMKDLYLWAQSNKYASEEQLKEKYIEFLEDRLSSVNYLGFMLALTSVGAIDMLDLGIAEADINDVLVALEAEAITSLVFATVIASIQLCIAALGLVFLILSIIGIVRKKDAPLFKSLMIFAMLSGVGLCLMFIAPLHAISGGMFALALTAVLSYFVLGTAKAVLSGKRGAFIVKRALCAAFAVVAFFLLCTDFLNTSVISKFGTNSTTESGVSTFPGAAFGAILESLLLGSITQEGVSITLEYSAMTMASSITVLALGLVSAILLYTAMLLSLRALADRTETAKRLDMPMLLGAVTLVLLAILPAVFGAVDELPVHSGWTGNIVACMYKYSSRAYVYVSIAFAVAAFVFGIAYDPRKKAAQPDDNAPVYAV